MNPRFQAAYQVLEQAQAARKRGDRHAARQYAEQALKLAPELEEPWLMMAALASPRASIGYLEQALKINPESDRARQGMHWAVRRLRAEDARQHAASPVEEKHAGGKAVSGRRISFPILFLAIACLMVVWAIWPGNTSPALAFIRQGASEPTQTHIPAGINADVAKPSYTPTFTPTWTLTPTFTTTPTATSTPTLTPTSTPTDTPTITLTPTITDTPLPTNTPWPTWTPVPVRPPLDIPRGVKWIDVNLSQQMVYAYEGDTLVASFLASTGLWNTPTVTGQYHIYIKVPVQTMTGPGYYLPGVQWVMYFYRDYGLHGTYWHNNFGTPMSHGCVNLRNADAEWLYYWAPYDTLVNVHY